jgi:predicted small lipoprotein YifL
MRRAVSEFGRSNFLRHLRFMLCPCDQFFQETCRIYGGDYRCDPNLSMKKLASTLLLIPTLIVALSGCGTSGPSPEQQTRDAQQQKDAERQQAEFRKGLPPVSNPGQGW